MSILDNINQKQRLSEAIEWAIVIVLAAACVTVGFFAGRSYERNSHPELPPVVPDTVTVTIRDTVTYHVPTPVYTTIVRHDTVELPSPAPTGKDGEGPVDCQFSIVNSQLTLPITQNIYRDSAYTAYVSGYRPSLDSIFIYNRHTVTTITQPVYTTVRKRWSVGPQVGISWCGHDLSPSIGIGITYDLLQW